MGYEIVELLPLIKELTEQYTGKASTSVTYETAQQLMGAILYCIQQAEAGDKDAAETQTTSIAPRHSLSAREAYQRGYGSVVNKVQEAQEIYSKILAIFHGCGNFYYESTVTKHMPKFFNWYDAKFNPQDSVIHLDYPILISLEQNQGIDRIYEYLQCVLLEQKFLIELKTEHVREILSSYHPGHRQLLINVCGIVLKKTLVNMMLEIPLQRVTLTPMEQDKLVFLASTRGREALISKLQEALKFLIDEIYQGDKQMYFYFQNCISDIAAELLNGASIDCPKNII